MHVASVFYAHILSWYVVVVISSLRYRVMVSLPAIAFSDGGSRATVGITLHTAHKVCRVRCIWFKSFIAAASC